MNEFEAIQDERGIDLTLMDYCAKMTLEERVRAAEMAADSVRWLQDVAKSVQSRVALGAPPR